tara:strand:+ start:1475 stop:2779 length:1305 start_codon:yes stop_codon:yes gene_type:complete
MTIYSAGQGYWIQTSAVINSVKNREKVHSLVDDITTDQSMFSSQSMADSYNIHKYSGYMDVFAEAGQLSQQGLIGKESLISMGAGEARVGYWSEKNHSQWQAYQQEGSEAGMEAAGLLKQMVSERQQLANNYLEGVMNLANKFNMHDLGGIGGIAFHQVLGNDEVGEPLALKRDGTLHDDADVITQFWQDNKNEIDQLKAVYSDLKNYPKDIEGWIDQRDIPVNDEVNLLTDRLKNSWVQGRVEAGDDYRPVSVFFADGSDTVSQQSIHGSAPDSLSLTRSLEEGMDKTARVWGRMGWMDQMDDIAAKELLHQQKNALYQEMQTLIKGMFDQFGNLFGQAPGAGNYSLQDMVDNYVGRRPLAMMDNGSLHPDAETIEQYWQENRLALEKYSFNQKELNGFPETYHEFLRRYPDEVRQHLHANLDRFLFPDEETA